MGTGHTEADGAPSPHPAAPSPSSTEASSPSFWGLFFFTQSDTCLRESKKKSPSFWLMTWGRGRCRDGGGLPEDCPPERALPGSGPLAAYGLGAALESAVRGLSACGAGSAPGPHLPLSWQPWLCSLVQHGCPWQAEAPTRQHLGSRSPPALHLPSPSPAHLVCNLDEETAALPGGQLQPGGNAVTHIPHPCVGNHLQHLDREAAGEAGAWRGASTAQDEPS